MSEFSIRHFPGSVSNLKSHTITISIFFISVVSLFGCNQIDSAHKEKDVVKYGDRIKFEFHGTRFEIPKKYFKGAGNSHTGGIESVSLWALLPNFEGYDADRNHYHFYEVYHHGRRIGIRLLARSRVMTVPEVVKKEESMGKYSILGGRHRGGKYDEVRYGLEYYKTYQVLGPTGLPGPRSIYLHRENGIPILKFRCSENEQASSPGCSVNWDYNENISVEYNFSKRYLPQWRKIWKNVNLLLKGEIDCCVN